MLRTKNAQFVVEKMMLSDNEIPESMIMSAWDSHQCAHLCDVDVGVIAVMLVILVIK